MISTGLKSNYALHTAFPSEKVPKTLHDLYSWAALSVNNVLVLRPPENDLQIQGEISTSSAEKNPPKLKTHHLTNSKVIASKLCLHFESSFKEKEGKNNVF